MKNSTKYKAWRVIIDSIEGVEVKEDTENNQMVAIKENNIIGLFDLELDLGSVKESQPTKNWLKDETGKWTVTQHAGAFSFSEAEKLANKYGGVVLLNDSINWWQLVLPDPRATDFEEETVKAKKLWYQRTHKVLREGVEVPKTYLEGLKLNEEYADQLRKKGQPVWSEEVFGPVKENKLGWMLKQDPVLAAKVKSNVDLAKKRQAAYGDPDWQKKQDEKKELAKESWLADDYVTWVDDSSKAKTFTKTEAEIVAKQVNGLASPRFPDGEETNSYVVTNINQYESIKEAALPEEDMIGGFRELSVGKNFWYGKTKYDWALKHDLPHEIVSDHGNRYAKVLNTVAYVAVDENEDGTPKLEKWYIKHFQKKETV